ncbi:GntR family transcriptional regulator [Arthrobacter sp. Z4-13]
MASDIVRYIEENRRPEGTRLVERKLGEHLKVSRSPVRHALQLLESQGIVRRSEAGGYVVAELGEVPSFTHRKQEDGLYERIALDRLEKRLPDRVTEQHLLRSYGCTKTELNETLRRISNEGWIDRRPGYGWEFLPMLDSMELYEESFRFRLTIEPAAILEPSFVLNADALLKCRAEQMQLIEGAVWEVPSSTLFELNSSLHEAVMDCSNNAFFIESLHRVDRRRRLIEYRQAVPRDRALELCKEHVQLLDLLLGGHNEAASAYLKEHLRGVSKEKQQPKDSRAGSVAEMPLPAVD